MPHNLVFKSLKGRGYSLRSPFDKENAKKPSHGFVCLSDLICFSTKKNPCYACTCNAMAHGAFVDRCPVVLSEQSKLLLSSFSVLTSEQRGGIIGVFSNKYYHHSVNYNVMSNNMHKDLLCFWYFKIKKNIYFSTNIVYYVSSGSKGMKYEKDIRCGTTRKYTGREAMTEHDYQD